MKKVMVVTDFFYPHWTGISKTIYYLTQAIKDQFEVTVLTVQFDKKLPSFENINGIRIIRKPYLLGLSRAKYSLSVISSFLQLANKFDTIIINSPCSNIFFVSLISKLFRKKLIICHLGDLILPRGIWNWCIEKIFNVLTFFSFCLADKLSTFTEDYALNSRLLPYFTKKTQAVFWPLPYFQELNKKFQHDSDLKKMLISLKNKHKFLIGFAGRFVEEKGFDILLKSIVELNKTRDDFHFVFAGETSISYEDTYIKNKGQIEKIKNQLTILGLLNDSQLMTFYSYLDVFILPSRSDCFALVQSEAMYAKVPVIVSNIPGARDAVKKTGFGLIFKSGDFIDLAEKILFLLGNAEKRRILSTNARKVAYERHFPKKVAEQAIQIYRNIIRRF